MTTLQTILDPKLIERQNKAFHKISKKKQRVAIAKDVMAQLKLNKYIATPGIYIDFDYNLLVESNDLQTLLLSKTPDCNVCGLGAAFCSLARLGDKVQEENINSIHQTLEPIFGMHQIGLIEYAFEGHDAGNLEVSGWISFSEDEVKACSQFYDRYSSASKRLAAIFRNIVKNEGTFKP